MPVTAKLSRLFYERLGDQVAGELTTWFNDVDATYRSDLREMNELNFARFDAKLEQRIVQVEAKVDARLAQLEARMDARFGQVDARFTQVEAKMDTRFAQSEALLERRLGEQTRWLFLAWASLLVPIVGLWMRG